jgi:hypothetical protein
MPFLGIRWSIGRGPQPEPLPETKNPVPEELKQKVKDIHGTVKPATSTPEPLSVSSDKIKELSQTPEADYMRQRFSWNPLKWTWIAKVIAWVHGTWSRKGREKGPIEAVKGTESKDAKPTDERLSRAARHIAPLFTGKRLESEGLFRISASASERKKLYQSLISTSASEPLPDLSAQQNDMLAGLFKEIYKQLDLFGSANLSAEIMQTGAQLKGMKDDNDMITSLKQLVKQLPEDRQKDLNLFIYVLAQTAKSSAVNKMNPTNLAIAAGINIWASAATFEQQQLGQAVAKAFIENYEKVFDGIPSWPAGV